MECLAAADRWCPWCVQKTRVSGINCSRVIMYTPATCIGLKNGRHFVDGFHDGVDPNVLE
jgi:hypothetical protein